MTDLAVPVAEALDVKTLLDVLARAKAGDFTARMPLEWTGVAGKVADSLNDMIIANQGLENELARVSRVVGKQGELSQRLVLGGHSQGWAGSVESVNSLIEALVRPPARCSASSARSPAATSARRSRPTCAGEMLELKNTDQRDGRPAQRLRLRAHPGGARGGHRGQARPGGGRDHRGRAASGRTSPTTST
jgi:hypothetical protein